MKSENNASWVGTAGRRAIVVVSLIVVVTLLWVALLMYTNLPAIAMVGIAIIGLLLLSTATAWAALAVPRRHNGSDSSSKD